ncbi:MAG: ribosomal protein S18-alanine N-acetyltransferase [Lachnospiraceae bacterium]|nr:ribosomal protein S18-alanine N-acetyltransferase [Lachnospiraceae bacterium]MBO4697460.1 ribosomal protein S18-alanine N-acetyltransferase [Lachnospiraceae bacterium]
MTEQWVPAVADLERRCFSEPWSEESLTDVLGRPEFRYLIACEGDKMLGYGGFYVAADEASITNIATEPEARGRGVAGNVIEAIIKEAAGMGAQTIYLEVRAGNEKAIRVYERCGFERLGVRKGFYDKPKEDAYIYGYRIER